MQVAANFHVLAKAFSEADYARIGVLGRDEFREILNKYTLRFNDSQVRDTLNDLLILDLKTFCTCTESA